MLDALISGRLIGTPQKRLAKSGYPFASAKVRAPMHDGTVVVVSVSAFEPEPMAALLVMTEGDRFEIVGGHTRHAAAKVAGLERVLCVVRDMDDDEATLRNASDNVATPPPWFDLCLYVYRNAVKDSKKGLSRTALTAAATGKTGNAAEIEGRRMASAGEVLAQSVHVDGLQPETNLTRHCAAISALPPEQYAPMLTLLLEHGWSVKDTQAAVERVPGHPELASALFASFDSWKRDNGEHAGSAKTFSQRLERTFDKKATNKGKVFKGLRLTDPFAGNGNAYAQARRGG